MSEDKIYFKYNLGCKYLAECRDESEDFKLKMPIKTINKVFLSNLLLEIDKEDYDKFVEIYNNQIDIMVHGVKDKEKDGKVYTRSHYGDVIEWETKRYMERRLMKSKKNSDNLIRCKLVFNDKLSETDI